MATAEERPEQKYAGLDHGKALEAAAEITQAGGLAWVDAEYGVEQNHDAESFQGWNLWFYSPERVQEAADRGQHARDGEPAEEPT